MIGRLLAKLGVLIALLCVGTIISQSLCLGYMVLTGSLSREKLGRVVAVMQGAEPTDTTHETKPHALKPSEELPSFNDMEQARALRVRDLELREQALSTGLESIRFREDQVQKARSRFDDLQNGFQDRLTEMREGALATGRDNVRLIWENIKPRQAKEQILQMLDAGEKDDVVRMLTAMPIGKRAKIVSEFKTEDETKKLDGILRLIREGVPEVTLIDNARQRLEQPETP